VIAGAFLYLLDVIAQASRKIILLRASFLACDQVPGSEKIFGAVSDRVRYEDLIWVVASTGSALGVVPAASEFSDQP
jgi:hypothetical protein